MFSCCWTVILLIGFSSTSAWMAQATNIGKQVPRSATSTIEEFSRADSQNHFALPSGSGAKFLLNSGWQIKVEGDQGDEIWQRDTTVPAAWEKELGIEFDSVATYRRTISELENRLLLRKWNSLNQANQHRLIIRIEGVATKATVRCNGHVVGTHVGAWTPWECDLTEVWNKADKNELEIEVDELVGHHTQGFLPIVAPHFGGIWKPVSLELVPSRRVLKERSLVLGRVAENEATIDFNLLTNTGLKERDRIQIKIDPPKRIKVTSQLNTNADNWLIGEGRSFQRTLSADEIKNEGDRLVFSLPLESAKLWSCEEPWLYDISVVLLTESEDGTETIISETWFRTGVRQVRTDGHRLLLNGKPIQVRGLLNWGYSPPSTAPSLSQTDMLKELEVVKDLQFNLMKFCLYVPPQEYLDLCDAFGVLAWMEYPTWHAQLIPENLESLSAEYREFTEYDRNHPSVILRSLTCETGSSADLTVIKSLYDLVHRQVPNCIVEDDSSWISWNRVSDFWDDHPYGNNHTWLKTLDDLKTYIEDNGAKPLILGEAIAADTWPDFHAARASATYPPQLQYGFTEAAQLFESQLAEQLGEQAIPNLRNDSIRYARLMRKYQLESFRREVPYGGAVVSVIRDFPLASMGLIDQEGKYKFDDDSVDFLQSPESTVVIETDNDRRSFVVGEAFKVDVFFVTPDPDLLSEGNISPRGWAIIREGDTVISRSTISLRRSLIGTSENSSAFHWQTSLNLSAPERAGEFQLEIVLQNGDDETEVVFNGWTLWAVPKLLHEAKLSIQLHQTAVEGSAAEWIAGAGLGEPKRWLGDPSCDIIVSQAWDAPLLAALVDGATVLMLPDGRKNSFEVGDHWFLRGAPIVHPSISEMEAFADLDWRKILVDLQHFDLAGPVQKNFVDWQSVTPLLMLWDSHDIKEVKVHGLAWGANVGKGRLAVSTLNHSAENSAVGPLMLERIVTALANHDTTPMWKNWPEELVQRLDSELNTIELNLVDQDWALKPDPKNQGVQLGWHLPDTELNDWTPIRIDRHWEGQGHSDLDGWAWYRCSVQIPKEWTAEQLYICFTGVDDHYRAYVNGQQVGSAGVIETKETAFELRSSYKLPGIIQPGDRIEIRIAVYDWYGSGGIFRPIFLRTQPLNDRPPLLTK